MQANRKLFLLLMMLGLVAVTAFLPQSAMAQIDNQDYGSGGSGGGTCNYCNQNNCGCAAGPGLTFSCSCSSIWCTRSCSYS